MHLEQTEATSDCAGEDRQQSNRPAVLKAPRAVTQYKVMSPVGLGIKNDCAGEDQQQFTRPTVSRRRKRPVKECMSARVTRSRGGVSSKSQTPRRVEEEATFQNM
jgi:hypothetical protein